MWFKNVYELYTRYPKTVGYGTETISFFSPKLWALIQQLIRDFTVMDKVFETNSSFHVK